MQLTKFENNGYFLIIPRMYVCKTLKFNLALKADCRYDINIEFRMLMICSYFLRLFLGLSS